MSADRDSSLLADNVPETTVEDELCEIEVTVPSGFEPTAKEEIEEKLEAKVLTSSRGRVNLSIRVKDVRKVVELRGVDNLMLVTNHFRNFPFTNNLEADLLLIRSIVPQVDWATALRVWAMFFTFPREISPLPAANISSTGTSSSECQEQLKDCSSESKMSRDECLHIENISLSESGENSIENATGISGLENTDSEQTPNSGGLSGVETCEIVSDVKPSETVKQPAKKIKNANLPSFRATCNRNGDHHSFQSPQAAANFGGEINNYFGWNVDLEHYDLEVVLKIDDNDLRVCVALTRESLHRRDIVKFGPTTLRPTIAYGMLRLCAIQPGEIVCDPMCGGGSIPIEGAISWPSAQHICGDISSQCTARTNNNVRAVNAKNTIKGINRVCVDIYQWDVCHLPLADSSIDVFITDMPFGKRSGSWQGNWQLYPRVLGELARVSRLETGRACLLTHDRKCITKSINSMSYLWRRGPTVGINIGGLAACVYMLYRTANIFQP